MELTKMLDEIFCDYTDVKLSQLTGIERTRINRIRNGKFKIELSELQKIISVFMIDDNTSRKLYEAYLYEKLGKDKYNSRQLAKEFLTNLNFDKNYTSLISTNIFSPQYDFSFDMPEEVAVINGVVSVKNIIIKILLQALSENDKIRIISSPKSEFLLPVLFSITSNDPNLSVDHIFSLASSNELTEPLTYYINVASAVYPIFMLNNSYQAYYSIVGHATNALMPYYIITSKVSLVFNANASYAIAVTNKDVVELQKKLFDERVKQCTSFINKINSTEQYFRHYCSMLEQSMSYGSELYYSLDYEPCLLSYLTMGEMEPCITRPGNSAELAELLHKFVNVFFKPFMNNRQISFFTKRGLKSFIDTGTIAEVPDCLGLVVSKPRRREVLMQVLDTMKNPNSKKIYYLLNENEFDPPLGLRFLGSGKKTDHMFVISNDLNGVRSILSLSNPQILHIVFDFIESLPETNMVYPHHEMVAFMEKTIEEMDI